MTKPTTLASTERGEHTPGIVERLRAHRYALPEGFYSDEDYGCNEAHPEDLIMAVLDSGPRGTKVMQELTACGYSIVETKAVDEAADLISELLEALDGLIGVAERNIYPQPDKPDSAWAKLERARAVAAKARGGAA